MINVCVPEQPLVTVVVISYNAIEYIKECLESIKKQSYINVELIICDDSSSDGTRDAIRDWLGLESGRFSAVKTFFSTENHGTTVNLNTGLRAADGEWVKIIAADDALAPHCISRYIEETERLPDANIFFADVERYQDRFVSSAKLPTGSLRDHAISSPLTSAEKQFRILLRENPIWAATLFFKNDVIEKIGYCDESVRLWEDRPLLLKATQRGEKVFFVDFIGARYRVHAASIQRNSRGDSLFSLLDIEQSSFMLNNYGQYMTGVDGCARKARMRFVLLLVGLGNKRNSFTRGIRFIVFRILALFQKKSYL